MQLVDTRSLSKMLHVSQSTISRLVHSRSIPHIYIRPGTLRFEISAIENWIKGKTVPPSSGTKDGGMGEKVNNQDVSVDKGLANRERR